MQLTKLLWTMGLLAIGAQGLPLSNIPSVSDASMQHRDGHISTYDGYNGIIGARNTENRHHADTDRSHEDKIDHRASGKEADQGYMGGGGGSPRRDMKQEADQGYNGRPRRALAEEADQGYFGGIGSRAIDATHISNDGSKRGVQEEADQGYNGAAKRGEDEATHIYNGGSPRGEQEKADQGYNGMAGWGK